MGGVLVNLNCLKILYLLENKGFVELSVEVIFWILMELCQDLIQLFLG